MNQDDFSTRTIITLRTAKCNHTDTFRHNFHTDGVQKPWIKTDHRRLNYCAREFTSKRSLIVDRNHFHVRQWDGNMKMFKWNKVLGLRIRSFFFLTRQWYVSQDLSSTTKITMLFWRIDNKIENCFYVSASLSALWIFALYFSLEIVALALMWMKKKQHPPI